MRLCDLSGENVIKPVLHYSEHAVNKPVRHNYEMQEIPGDPTWSGIAHHAALYKGVEKRDECGMPRYSIFLFYPGLKFGLIFAKGINDLPEHGIFHTVEEVIGRFRGTPYETLDDFLKHLDETAGTNGHIDLVTIEFVKQFDPERAERYAASRLAYRERKDAEYAERRKQREAEHAAYVKEKNEKAESAIETAIATIKNGGEIRNDAIEIFKNRYESNCYALVNVLCRRYGIKVPLRTQGWIANKLDSFTVKDGQFVGAMYLPKRRGEKPSATYQDCIKQLIAAVLTDGFED